MSGAGAAGPALVRVRIKGHAGSAVRFFLIAMAFMILWILITAQLGHYSKLYGPQVLLQLNIAFYLPSIPLLLLSPLLERWLDASAGPVPSLMLRINAGLVGCLVLCVAFPFLPEPRYPTPTEPHADTLAASLLPLPTNSATTSALGADLAAGSALAADAGGPDRSRHEHLCLSLLLGVVALLGTASSLAFATAYQLAQNFRAADTIAIGIGCVGSGPLVLVFALALGGVGPSPARWQWIAIFEMGAAVILAGLASSLSLFGQYWKVLTGAEQFVDAYPSKQPSKQPSAYASAADVRQPLLGPGQGQGGSAAADNDQGAPGGAAAAAAGASGGAAVAVSVFASGTAAAAASAGGASRSSGGGGGGLRPSLDQMHSGGSSSRAPRPLTAPDPFNPMLLTPGPEHDADIWAEWDASPVLLRRASSAGYDRGARLRRGALAGQPSDPATGSGAAKASLWRRAKSVMPRLGTSAPTTPEVSARGGGAAAAAAIGLPQATDVSVGYRLIDVLAAEGDDSDMEQGSMALPGGGQRQAGAGEAGDAAQLLPGDQAAGGEAAAPGGAGDEWQMMSVGQEVAEVLRLAWRVLIGFFFSVTILYMVFPFFTYVPSSGLMGESLPQVLFYIRLFADIAGRLAPRCRPLLLRSQGAVLALAGLQLCVAGLFFGYLLAPASAAHRLHHDPLALLMVVVLWLLGGYLNTCCNILAPATVAPQVSVRASSLMALAFQVAHFLGLILAAALAAAVYGDVIG